jgi:2-pyrone-4,6-dicarboxylate lactonase
MTDRERRAPCPVPAGSWDCHVHIFDPRHFPYAEERRYTPGPASLPSLSDAEARFSPALRPVLVQPSVYGTDNTCLAAALRSTAGAARGIAVIDPDTVTDVALEELHRAGVRGVRMNLHSQDVRDPGMAGRALAAAARRVAPWRWCLQIYADLDVIAGAAPVIAGLGMPVIADHFCGFRGDAEIDPAQAATVLALLASGPLIAKLSAPYRAFGTKQGEARTARWVRQLVATAPRRLIWGSDWPHTGGGVTPAAREADEIEPFRDVDAVADLRLITGWIGDDAVTQAMLADTPARLFAW